MLAGAAMADVAVLVVDARQLESGMSVKGQTREHVVLAWASGIRRMIVAVNKMDATTGEGTGWDENLLLRVKEEVGELLKGVGFAQDAVSFVPCSGLTGANVVTAPTDSAASWIPSTSTTLLSALELTAATLSPPDTPTLSSPLSLQISDIFTSSQNHPLSISGRLTSGTLQPNQPLLLLPSTETATIRAIDINGENRPYAIPCDLVTLHLAADFDATRLRAGDIVCDPARPASVTKIFVARVQAIGALLPMGVDVHIGRLHVGGKVAALMQVVDEAGEMVRRKPRVVKVGEWADVKVVVEESLPIGAGGRIVLRTGGDTVAAGVVRVSGAG